MTLCQSKSLELGEQEELAETFASLLLSALRASNWDPTTDRKIGRMCLDGASSVLQKALEVEKAIHQDVTSVDLRVCIVCPGAIFDHNRMEDPDTDAAQANGENVAFSLALGMKLGDEEDGPCMLKPKVILQTTIAELLEDD